MTNTLVGVSQTTHTAHDTKHVVVGGKHADLGSAGTLDGGIGQHELESSVVNAREVARARWLVLFRAKGEGVQVDTGVWVAGVVLPWLNEVEVGALALREAVLAVELQLGSDNGVLTPAVHVKSGLSKHEGAGIRDSRLDAVWGRADTKGAHVRSGASSPVLVSVRGSDVDGTSLLEEAVSTDEAGSARNGLGAAERVDSVGKSVKSVSVVEGLSTKELEQNVASIQG